MNGKGWVMAHFKVLSQKLHLGSKEYHETSRNGWLPLRDFKWGHLENTG